VTPASRLPLGVVKVGGSLFDLPELGPRLERWLERYHTATGRGVALLPGGGAAADVVRDLDRIHRLGEERSHWLALHALTVNAHFLANLLPRAVVVRDEENLRLAGEQGQVPVLDAAAFLAADEARNRGPTLPHTWEATSDSVAARLALVLRARELVLLKSARLSPGAQWSDAARLGLVDPVFAGLVRGTAGLVVRLVDFRTWSGD
jgi:aspartokinase-like uncharacterized kinase